uniref:Uncharacterized protein n=1 Tax=Setaria digitata TaxID=48799 RepID=A0A915PN26_9BILA
MGDDYEILDPTKAEPNANVEPAPETPIQSSIEKTVVGVGPAIGGSKRKNGKANQTGKAILGKKDVEIKVEKTKLTKKDEEKAVQQRRSDKELVDEVSDNIQ